MAAAFVAGASGNTGTTGLIADVAARAVVLRWFLATVVTSGWLGTARGGKSCADERPGGTGVDADGNCVGTRAGDSTSYALLVTSSIGLSLEAGWASRGICGNSVMHVD